MPSRKKNIIWKEFTEITNKSLYTLYYNNNHRSIYYK